LQLVVVPLVISPLNPFRYGYQSNANEESKIMTMKQKVASSTSFDFTQINHKMEEMSHSNMQGRKLAG
jgi:hypothetical protein